MIRRDRGGVRISSIERRLRILRRRCDLPTGPASPWQVHGIAEMPKIIPVPYPDELDRLGVEIALKILHARPVRIDPCGVSIQIDVQHAAERGEIPVKVFEMANELTVYICWKVCR